MKKKIFIVQMLDSKNPSGKSFTQVNDALFYSNDTDAHLVFLPHEQERFEFNEATVALYNIDDGSLVERPAVIETFEGRKSVVLKMTEDILAHWGRWQAQVVFKQGDKINTSVVVKFDTLRYMLDQRPPTLRDVIKVDELYSQLVTVMDEIAGKDVISAPEIILARGEENTLGERLDKEHNEVTTQLAQKVGSGTKAQLEDLSPSVLSAIEGGVGTSFNLLSIPQDKSVSPAKTTFIETSINIADREGELEKTNIDPTGNITSHDNFNLTQFYQVKPNTTYSQFGYQVANHFDENLNWLKRDGILADDYTTPFTTPENGHWIRLSYDNRIDGLDERRVNEGSVLLPYEPYKEKLSEKIEVNVELKPDDITSSIVAKNHVGITDDLLDITIGRESSVTNNEYGEYVIPPTKYIRSDITLTPGVNYNILVDTHIVDGSGENYIYYNPEIGVAVRVYAEHLGDGVYLLSDIKGTEPIRFIVNNFSSSDILVKKVYVGINGVPNVRSINYTNGSELENFGMVQVKKNISGRELVQLHDYNKYPLYPVWGHEYMYSWYVKIRERAPLKMVWAGDSTTFNGALMEDNKRHALGKKIMTLGGYNEELITSINAGHGTQHTGNWLGGDLDEDKRTPNGFLDEDMLQNPDLYVLAYGYNDGSDGHFPNLTMQQRVDRFETNLNMGLERIRGSQYNKSAEDMAIILCTPNSTNSSTGVNPQTWHDRIRPIIQKACRDYHCAFVDIGARQYDHSFSDSWSTNNDKVHPNNTANLDYMSMFADLLYPYLMHI